MTSKTTHVISCGTCIYRENNGSFEILLVRPFENRETWGIPKGHIEQGETLEQCAIRETIEETGIVPKLLDQLPPVIAKYGNKKVGFEIKTVYGYLAVQADKDSKISPIFDENFDVRWFDVKFLPKLHRYQISLVANAVKMINSSSTP